MSFAPFDVQPVADRIKAGVAGLRLVGLAADYAAVKSLRDFTPPSVFVVLAQENFDGAKTGNGQRGEQVRTTQRGTVAVGVVIVGRNYREQGGAQLSDAMNALIGSVRGVLAGWVPDVPGARPFEMQRGDLLRYDDATALWCDVWKTQTFIGAEAQ
ncbi:phage tail terminator protein [Rhodanobacter sp. UC4450_H17]